MSQRGKSIYLYLLFILLSMISIGLAIAVGSTSITLSTLFQSIGRHLFLIPENLGLDQTKELILWQIRAPRVVLAYLVGASLSVAGAAFQGLLRNPLADPYTLGVSSGASLGAVIAVFFHLSVSWLGGFEIPLFSFAGALLSLGLVYLLANMGYRLMIETLILSGIIIGSFIGAFISLLIALSGQELRQIISWLLGSVANRDWSHVLILLPFFFIGLVLLLFFARGLDLLSFGEESAATMGLDTEGTKRGILLSASLLTAAAVSVSGVIGFVGLVIPHFIRLLIGPSHIHLLPLSALGGGVFLVMADMLARTIVAPMDLPIGVVTALIGAPTFAYLLWRVRREEDLNGE